jgi:hypothetical protein
VSKHDFRGALDSRQCLLTLWNAIAEAPGAALTVLDEE